MPHKLTASLIILAQIQTPQLQAPQFPQFQVPQIQQAPQVQQFPQAPQIPGASRAPQDLRNWPKPCQRLHSEVNKCENGLKSCDQKKIDHYRRLCERAEPHGE